MRGENQTVGHLRGDRKNPRVRGGHSARDPRCANRADCRACRNYPGEAEVLHGALRPSRKAGRAGFRGAAALSRGLSLPDRRIGIPLSHLLEASIYSQPIKDNPVPGVLGRWASTGDERLCTAAIRLAEVLQGLTERDSAKYWWRYRELLENRYPVLSFDAGTAEKAVVLPRAEGCLGRPASIGRTTA